MGMFGGGPIVKGAAWVIKNLKKSRKEIIEGTGQFSKLNPMQQKILKKELNTLIKQLEQGEKIPGDMLDTMMKDKRFKDIVKTPSTDPELRELEEVLLDHQQSYLDYAKKQSEASGSLAKQFGYGEYAPSEIKKRQMDILKEFDVTAKKGHASGGLAHMLGE